MAALQDNEWVNFNISFKKTRNSSFISTLRLHRSTV